MKDRICTGEQVTVCRHCCRNKPNRPRGLCWTCYYTPGVRGLFERRSPRGLDDFVGEGHMPEPTTAKPGTPEKVAVLAARAEAGQRLWHPDDAEW
jgi:hypothetical protein